MSSIGKIEFATVKILSEEVEKMLVKPSYSPASSGFVYLELRSILLMLSNSYMQLPSKTNALNKRMIRLMQIARKSSVNQKLCNLLSEVNKAAMFYLLSKEKKKQELQYIELEALIENPLFKQTDLSNDCVIFKFSQEKVDLFVKELRFTINGLFSDKNDKDKRASFKIRMERMFGVLQNTPFEEFPWEAVDKIYIINQWVLNIFKKSEMCSKKTQKSLVKKEPPSTSNSSFQASFFLDLTDCLSPRTPTETSVPSDKSTSSSSSSSFASGYTEYLDPLPPFEISVPSDKSTSSNSSSSFASGYKEYLDPLTPFEISVPSDKPTSSSPPSSQFSADTNDSVDSIPDGISQLWYAVSHVEAMGFKNPLQETIDSEVSYDALEAVQMQNRAAIPVKNRSRTRPSCKTRNTTPSFITRSKKRKKNSNSAKKGK